MDEILFFNYLQTHKIKLERKFYLPQFFLANVISFFSSCILTLDNITFNLFNLFIFSMASTLFKLHRLSMFHFHGHLRNLLFMKFYLILNDCGLVLYNKLAVFYHFFIIIIFIIYIELNSKLSYVQLNVCNNLPMNFMLFFIFSDT